jgi:hypothetical protein
MMSAKRNISCWAWLGLFLLSQAGLWAVDAVNVTLEVDATTLAVGESAMITVYGEIDAAIEADCDLIFSWYVDVLNDNGGAVGGYGNVQTPASDNAPDLSGDGTPEGANLRGIHDTFFFNNPGAGKGARVVLVQFEVTALATGSSTFSVEAGSTVGGGLSDLLVSQTVGGFFAGGNYAAASVEIIVTGELDLSTLNLQVSSSGDITFNPIAGFDHTVQFSDTLLSLSWVDLPGGPHNAGAVNQVVTGIPERFYRVVLSTP